MSDPREHASITNLLGRELQMAPGFEEAEVWYGHLASNHAVRVWERISASRDAHGYYPVLCSDRWPEGIVDDVLKLMRPPDGMTDQLVRDTLAQAQELPFPTWLDQERDPAHQVEKYLQLAQQLESLGENAKGMADLYRDIAESYRGKDRWRFRAEDYPWPDVKPPPRSLSQLHTLSEASEPWDKYHAKPLVAMLLIRTQHAFEIPARLNFGGFNACPPPPVHVAFLRWMEERFGSELIGTCGDTLEITMPRRPANREEALRLACDLSIYAEEPEHGDWKPGQLAAFLMHTDVISFWWD